MSFPGFANKGFNIALAKERALVQMVENQRKRSGFSYLDKAIFEPSKIAFFENEKS